MKVNSEILKILNEYNINQLEGISFLTLIYHNLFPYFLPEELKTKLEKTGIFTINNQEVVWNIALYEEQLINFEWVKEYREAFKKINPDRAGTLPFCIVKMKKFFSENPSVRMEEVKGAVNMYFRTVKDPQYLIKAQNFISKGKGLEKESELQVWIERYRETLGEAKGRASLTNTMK